MAQTFALTAPAELRSATYQAATAWWEKAIAFTGFLLILGTFKAFLLSGGAARTEGSALFQVLSGGIYVSAAVTILIRGTPSWAPRVFVYAVPLIALTLLAILSALWSQDPTTTFRRAVALCMCFGFSVFLMLRFDLRTVFNLLAIAFLVFVVVGVLAAGLPGVGITPGGQAYPGSWRGLSGQKNVFGRTLAICLAILPLALAFGLTDRRKTVIFSAVIGFALLLLSQSATSLVAAISAVIIGGVLYVALGGVVRGFRLRSEIGFTFLAIVAIVVALTIVYGWTAILEGLGRDPTLTGRTKLWQWTMQVNEARMWLGSGYRSFWIDANTKYFFEFFAWAQDAEGKLSDSFSGPDHAHSGYMDTYLELGLVGVLAFGAVIVSSFVYLRRALLLGSRAIGYLFAANMSFLLIYAVTEKSILQQSEDLWFLFVTLYLLTIKEIVQRSANTRHPKMALA